MIKRLLQSFKRKERPIQVTRKSVDCSIHNKIHRKLAWELAQRQIQEKS